MNIPLCDIRASDAPYRAEIDDAIKNVIDKSKFILNSNNDKWCPVRDFEENFAKYIGVKHCVGVSSCTAALHLALEVAVDKSCLIPTRTVTADIEAVCLAKMASYLYDNPSYVHMAAPPETIIVVHLYGMPCDVSKMQVGFETIIEDCAQATGSEVNGKKCGSLGDISCFSFFPSKPLGCYGDGGAVCTNDDELAEEVRALRNHGRKQGEKYKHDFIGYNYRLDGLQAAMLNVKLRHLPNAIKRRRNISKIYERWLEDIEEIKIPIEPPNCKSAYYTYTIEADKRDDLRDFLKSNGISTGLHYPIPLHRQPAYADPKYDFPEADAWALRTLSLPMFPALTEENVKYISQKVREFYG